ncbi:MAG: CatA-like O-acetyltransferase [Defluviitaleaceae bacterium]|nr:CatA-like O-acetyltransferase [Defluviitaleaceae bacterium]
MNNEYQVIDTANWKRAIHYNVFRNFMIPHISISTELDITNFYRKTKENNLSFSFAFMYAVTKCANEIEEFRYRFYEGDVVLYNKISSTFTYMNKEAELFKVVTVPIKDDIEDYIKTAIETAKSQKEYFTGPLANNTLILSALPWITYTHQSNTFSGNKEDAKLNIHWGKYYEKDGNLVMPFSVQAHHSFVDGLHISKLVNQLQEYIDNL